MYIYFGVTKRSCKQTFELANTNWIFFCLAADTPNRSTCIVQWAESDFLPQQTHRDVCQVSHVMTKPAFAICEQQRHRSACASAQSDHRLCCLLLRKYISCFFMCNFKTLAVSEAEQAGLNLTWAQTPKTGFLVMLLKWYRSTVVPRYNDHLYNGNLDF